MKVIKDRLSSLSSRLVVDSEDEVAEEVGVVVVVAAAVELDNAAAASAKKQLVLVEDKDREAHHIEVAKVLTSRISSLSVRSKLRSST